MSQENVQLTRGAFQAFDDRDLDALLAVLDDDVEAFPILAGMDGGYRGHEGIRRWWQDLLDASPDFTVEIVEVRDLGDVTLTKVQARGHGAGSDIPFEETIWSVARWRGKKSVWSRVLATEAEALEAVGLSE
jgi:ketosteroid isomerase-like protein